MDLTRFNLLLQSKQYKDLSGAATAGKSVHAYLIEGERGAGKKSLALLLAAALLCRQAEKPCLECNICRRVLEQKHPDVHIFATEKKSISVADMRSLIAQALASSYEGGARVFIIPDADTMTVQAQNCLLKTLEEPDGNAVFILLARSGELMLSTVRSRVRRVRLGGFDAPAICRQLKLLDIPDADAVAESCGGCIGRALELAQGDALVAQAEQLLDMAKNKDTIGIIALLNKNKDDIAHLLELAEARLALCLGQQPQSNRTLKQLIAIGNAQRRIRGNISFTLTADRLAAELVQA